MDSEIALFFSVQINHSSSTLRNEVNLQMGKSFRFSNALLLDIALTIIATELLFQIHSSIYAGVDSKPTELLDPKNAIANFTIYTVPKPFVGENERIQSIAIKSWLSLHPKPKVVLLGSHDSFSRFASQFGAEVIVDQRVDTNFKGQALFNSVYSKIRYADPELGVILLLNSDIVLLKDAWQILARISTRFKSWLAVSSPILIQELPNNFSQELSSQEQRDFLRKNAVLDNIAPISMWIWKGSFGSTQAEIISEMPPFIFGEYYSDNWLVQRWLRNNLSEVVDLTESAIGFSLGRSERNFLSSEFKITWERSLNGFLALQTDCFEAHHGATMYAPWILSSCKMRKESFCFVRRKNPTSCRCENSPYWKLTSGDMDPDYDRMKFFCSFKSPESVPDKWVVRSRHISMNDPSYVVGNPFSLEALLSLTSDSFNNIILTVADVGNQNLLKNFICNMRRLQINNFLVAALDPKTYNFAYTHGAPVYLENPLDFLNLDRSEGCEQGSLCGKHMSRAKAKSVIRILRRGYNVLFSDLDVVWFQDFRAHMQAYGRGIFPLMSSEPDPGKPANGHRRASSALFFARNESAVIEVLSKAVVLSEKSSLSFQTVIYELLCGEIASSRPSGDGNSCTNPKLKTIFLPREKFSNAYYHGLWNIDQDLRMFAPKLMSLSNSAINGTLGKVDRLKHAGLWFVHENLLMCRWD